jgi:hypothetical protein
MDCYITLNGGMGNQLFETAAAYAHAKRIGASLYVIPQWHKSYFDTFLRRFNKDTNPKNIDWREPHFHYCPIPVHAQSLYGYFQSSKYFNDVSGDIRELFSLPETIQQTVQEKYSSVLTDKENTVVVHVRRGDYLYTPRFHGIIREPYYIRAIDAARAALPECRLVIFSDDLQWCRSQPYFAHENTVFVDEPNDVLSLHLMSQFKHYIIPNSTFSWWAVWLSNSNGHVWAPNKWFGPDGPQDWHDIYEPNWIQIPID